MKRYTLNNEQWLHIPKVELTPEEIDILKGEDNEQSQALREDIEGRHQPIAATNEEIDVLSEIYGNYLPEMDENDVFEFMSFNIAVENKKAIGCFNYKLNGNHVNVIIK